MSREVGIGMVGLGWMGQLHSRAYRRLHDHFPESEVSPRLVIVADEVEEVARESAGRLGYEDWTTDWRKVVEHPEVEAVSITVPNYLHREVAVAAAEAGKHFWIEKPCGRFAWETADIGRAAREAGVTTMVGLDYRYAPAVEHAKKLIEEGELGEITHYRGYFLADYASDPWSPRGALSWRYKEAYGGLGVFGDIMSHAADMAINLAGPITQVAAQKAIFIESRFETPPEAGEEGETGSVENEDYVSSLVEFESGARGTLEVSRVALGPHTQMSFELSGTRGALAWDLQRMNELRFYSSGAKGGDGYRTIFATSGIGEFDRFQPSAGIPMGYDDLKVIEAERFLASIADGRQREPSIEEGVAVMEVIDAMDRSCDSRTWEDVVEVRPSTVGEREG